MLDTYGNKKIRARHLPDHLRRIVSPDILCVPAIPLYHGVGGCPIDIAPSSV